MNRAAGKNVVNRAMCGKTFGVSVKTIDAWVRRGCPVERKGRKGVEWLFDTVAVYRWHMEAVEAPTARADAPEEAQSIPATYEQARARKMAAEAAIAEIEQARAEGSVADLDMVIDVVTQEYATIRARITSLPGQLAAQLDPARAAEFLPLIASEVDDILKELSADETIGDPDGEPGGSRRPVDGGQTEDAEAGSAA